MCRPFRAWRPIATTTRGGATLCPGLICPGPFGATHRAPEDPERRPEPADLPTASFPSEAGRSRPTASGLRTERTRRWKIRQWTDPIAASDVRAGKTDQPSLQRPRGLPTNDDVDRAATSQPDHFRGPSPPLRSNILLRSSAFHGQLPGAPLRRPLRYRRMVPCLHSVPVGDRPVTGPLYG